MGKYSWIIILIFAFTWLAFIFVGDHGLPKLFAINRELNTLEAKNRALETDITETKNKIYSLSSDDLTLERRAREELGLVKPGEVVYIFPDKSSQAEGQNDE